MANPRETLAKWRGERSVRKAAEILGVPKSTLWAIEQGKMAPNLAVALKLRDVCRIPVEAWNG